MSADPEELSRESGLEPRYYVKKLNDAAHKHDDCRYFVLDPQHDWIARLAISKYVDVAREEGLVALADDLDALVRESTRRKAEEEERLQDAVGELIERGTVTHDSLHHELGEN